MAGQGVLIIIIPNDSKKNQEQSLDVVEIAKEVSEPKSKSNEPLSVIEHTKEFPCSMCGGSLASRFRHHVSPKLNLVDAIWILSEDRRNFFITCFAELGQHSDLILQELRLAEIGIRQGSKVFILPLSCGLGIDKLSSSLSTIVEMNNLNEAAKETTTGDEFQALVDNVDELNERPRKTKSDFKRSIRARLTVLQVVNAIRGQTSFSFDFLLLTILASMIASMGLLEDNSVILVASMLVSPLMGPILGIVFGLCIGDATLWKAGLKTEAIGLLITIFTGFIVGLCTTWSEAKWGSSTSFPTYEMRSRGDIRRLWAGALVALPSGAGAALSVLGGNVGSLVGVAISASLLPPAVNAGLLSSYSLLSMFIPSIGKQSPRVEYNEKLNSSINILKNCTKFIGNDYIPIYSCHMATEVGLLGICSFLLTMTNIICIIVVAMGILRIKEVVPIVRDDEIAQFWHDDVRTYRDYNKSVSRSEVSNLVNLWRAISVNDQSTASNEHNAPEEPNVIKGTIKHRTTFRDGQVSQMILVRKLQNLEEFANAYNLNLSSIDDTLLKTDRARENVQRMADDILASIEETNRINLGSFVAQMGGGNNRRLLTHSRIQTFYQELLDVMPSKWKEIFQQRQQKLI